MKENFAKIDGNGNMLIQDINGATISINYNETDKISELLSNFQQKLQETIQISQKKEFNQIIDLLTKVLEMNKIKNDIQNPSENYKFKNSRLITLETNLENSYALLANWEQELILAENPTKKKRSEFEIDNLKNIISIYQNEHSILRKQTSFDLQSEISRLRKKQLLSKNIYDLEKTQFEVKRLIEKYPDNFELYDLLKNTEIAYRYKNKMNNEMVYSSNESNLAYKKSFSLLKLLIVIVLIIILTAILIWMFS